MKPTIVALISLVLLACTFVNPISNSEVEKLIKEWYKKHKKGYTIQIPSHEAKAEITRYHPEQPEEKNRLIRVKWKGMSITMAFNKPIVDINWDKESLQSSFGYVVLDDIYFAPPVEGWNLHPKTPVSSTSKGVTFTKVADGKLAFTIDWQTYTVSGYAKTTYCQDRLEIADASIPTECYAGVRKYLPLHLDVEVALSK